MNPWLGFGLALVSVVVIPTEVALVRMAVRWSKVEGTMADIADELRKLTTDKDREHQMIRESAMHDRNATDKRLRWLEENVWNRRKSEG